MAFSTALLDIYRADGVAAALRALVQAVSDDGPIHGGVWIGPDRTVHQQWPPTTEVTPELIGTAFHILNPEIVPLGSEFPFDASRYPASEALVLPVGERDAREVCLLLAPERALGDDTAAWGQLAEALERCRQREQERLSLTERTAELQRRVEESEALHTLGLAANRTLDTEEVVRLVARFTRTLLGADYVTLSTTQSGRVETIASVGLRNAEAAAADYLLGRRVVEAEKPLKLGAGRADLKVEDYPYHLAEGMQGGLGIPLSLFGETFGALVVGYRRPTEVSPRDVRFALTLAGHAAVAISNARLHERVEERSRELEIAYQDLHTAMQAKERFFAAVNHELRNPIGAVVGYLKLTLESPSAIPEPERTFLEKALRAGNNLVSLVNDLLDLSKLAAGRMHFELQPCSLGDIIAATIDTIDPMANARGIPVRVDTPSRLPLVHTNAQRAQQILVNLLSNGIKFTGPGGVVLETVVFPSDGAGSAPAWVELRVIDCGPGIAPDDQPRIFEEFEQVKGTSGGTGLGLPIARRLAKLLGGDLLLESEVGKGSTFALRLPVWSQAAAAGLPPE